MTQDPKTGLVRDSAKDRTIPTFLPMIINRESEVLIVPSSDVLSENGRKYTDIVLEKIREKNQ